MQNYLGFGAGFLFFGCAGLRKESCNYCCNKGYQESHDTGRQDCLFISRGNPEYGEYKPRDDGGQDRLGVETFPEQCQDDNHREGASDTRPYIAYQRINEIGGYNEGDSKGNYGNGCRYNPGKL